MSNNQYIERLFDGAFGFANGVSVEALPNVCNESVKTISDLLW